MRIVSWNIEHGRRIEQAVDDIEGDDQLGSADIFLAQELAPENAEQLADLLSIEYHHWAPAPHPQTGRPFGNAILSRWPMTERRHIALPHTASVTGQPRGATVATVNVGSTAVVAYSVHLETVLLRLARRVDQLRAIATDITRNESGPVIVGGDFNTGSVRSIAAFDTTLSTTGLVRVTNPNLSTLHRFRRSFALDHIYARSLESVASGVGGRTTASDHFPVWVELEPATTH